MNIQIYNLHMYTCLRKIDNKGSQSNKSTQTTTFQTTLIESLNVSKCITYRHEITFPVKDSWKYITYILILTISFQPDITWKLVVKLVMIVNRSLSATILYPEKHEPKKIKIQSSLSLRPPVLRDCLFTVPKVQFSL